MGRQQWRLPGVVADPLPPVSLGRPAPSSLLMASLYASPRPSCSSSIQSFGAVLWAVPVADVQPWRPRRPGGRMLTAAALAALLLHTSRGESERGEGGAGAGSPGARDRGRAGGGQGGVAEELEGATGDLTYRCGVGASRRCRCVKTAPLSSCRDALPTDVCVRVRLGKGGRPKGRPDWGSGQRARLICCWAYWVNFRVGPGRLDH
jgi:hypothetical protein